jgi:hypothetical protein
MRVMNGASRWLDALAGTTLARRDAVSTAETANRARIEIMMFSTCL